MKVLKEKEESIKKKKEKKVRRKEELTMDVQKYGLWTSAEEVDAALRALATVSEKRSALRAQLLFRKSVLSQDAPGRRFALSKSGKLLSIGSLAENLKSLFPVSGTSSTVEAAPSAGLSSQTGSSLEPQPMAEEHTPPAAVSSVTSDDLTAAATACPAQIEESPEPSPKRLMPSLEK